MFGKNKAVRLKRGRVLFWLVIVVLAALLAVLVGCGVGVRSAPPRVDEGAERLRVVTLDPLGLTIKRSDVSWTICQNFELRVLEEGGPKSLLIRGTLFLRGAEFDTDAEGHLFEKRPPEVEYSDNTYAVSLDGSFGVRKIGGEEWARARALTEEERGLGPPRFAERRFFLYEGRTLPEGGATRGGLPLTRLEVGGAEEPRWLLSQGGGYVAAFSHTSRHGEKKSSGFFPFIGGSDGIEDGTMYFDFFDGSTGQRLARVSKGHNGSGEFYVFEQAVWFEGRYFAMPLERPLGVWLIGVLPG